MTRVILRPFVVVVLVATATTFAPPARAQSLGDKQEQAAVLQAKIRSQGQRLSIAAEDYNEARVQRQELQAKASTARSSVVAAERRWAELRAQLGKRARLLYMHPGAAVDAFLGAKSLGEVARARVYGGEVLLTDSDLVMKAESARREVMEQAEALDALREAAERKEGELAARRSQVQRELGAQQALLSDVKGDIAEIIEAERARQAAAAAAASTAAAPSAVTEEPKQAAEPAEPTSPAPAVRASAAKAVATAAAQIGKPYEWGAAGPNSFDCSGLTMYAWAAAGVSLPHSSRAQYSSLPHVARSDIAPGDLLFFGDPIHHVGIYEGGGTMINAPETGEHVRRDSISRSDYVGAARP